MKFRASKEVREVMFLDPDLSGKWLAMVAKQFVREQENDQKLSSLQQFRKQGHMSRCSSSDGAKVWAKVLDTAPDNNLKFALKSAVDTLPHNVNLLLWRKHRSRACPLCGEKQTLIHILNTCRVARDEWRFNPRQDAILSLIVNLLSANTSPTVKFSSDLGIYAFSQHVVATDLRPDIVWWDDTAKKILLIELADSLL